MRTNELTRRSVVLGLVAVGALAAVGGPVRAASTAQASALVTTLAQELTQIVKSGRSESQVIGAFQGILSRYADMPAVAASVLGPPWRGASGGQRQAFVAAFQGYLARKYGKQFRDYKDAQITVTGAQDGGKAGVLVATRVKRPGQEDINVGWQVSDRSGSPRVVNLVIEGVSMLANERAEVGAMLDSQGGSVDGLIKQMQTMG